MMLETVRRVVSRAHHLDVETLHYVLRAELLGVQHGGAGVVNLACRLRFQYRVDAENAAQLHVSPVIQRVAHGVGDGRRPLLEFLVIAPVACDILLADAVTTHGPPLVVVATEPYLSQIVELIVLGYHLGIEMTVIVYDGLMLRRGVIQFSGGVVRQHEVLVYEHLRMVVR